MSQSEIKKRFHALGYDLESLPHRTLCASCNNTEPGDFSFDIFSAHWTIWCGCGCSTDPQPDLIKAMNDWNSLQKSIANVNRKQTNGELSYEN